MICNLVMLNKLVLSGCQRAINVFSFEPPANTKFTFNRTNSVFIINNILGANSPIIKLEVKRMSHPHVLLCLTNVQHNKNLFCRETTFIFLCL